jgi:acetylornithine deacetylase/succinyl-diaminopimelate desuccinylase-like protein
MVAGLDEIEVQLNAQIATLRPQMAEVCAALLRIPSVNSVNDELQLAVMIAQYAGALGLQARLVAEDPRRPNVIVSTADRGETGLLLLGHLDTVPPGDESAWAHPPFGGETVGERIYGRGAIDTKGGMTAALFALSVLAQTPGALHGGRAQLICVPNEESGATGHLGIRTLTREGLLPQAKGAIYAYSGHEIALGHRGLIRYRLTCSGQSVHTGAESWQNRTEGANAVTGMARLLLALEAIDLPFSTTRYFEDFKTLVTPGTMINGGTSINVVPDRCEALIDIRLTPEYDLERFQPLLDAAIADVSANRRGLSYSTELLNYVPAAISDENAPLFAVAEQAVIDVTGEKPPRVVAGPANEGYLLIEQGIPTICGLGPTGANAHAPDEYVEIDGLVDAASIFALVARRLS